MIYVNAPQKITANWPKHLQNSKYANYSSKYHVYRNRLTSFKAVSKKPSTLHISIHKSPFISCIEQYDGWWYDDDFLKGGKIRGKAYQRGLKKLYGQNSYSGLLLNRFVFWWRKSLLHTRISTTWRGNGSKFQTFQLTLIFLFFSIQWEILTTFLVLFWVLIVTY